MSTDNSSDNSGGSFDNSEVPIPRIVRFWLMFLFNSPSVVCSFCIIIHIITDRTQRQALHNHMILVILIFSLPVQLMDITFHLVFYQYGSVQPPKPIICVLWWVADYGFYNGGIILMVWLAIERHILIFHDRWVSTRRGRFLVHYLPLIVILTYIILFYGIAFLLIPCQNTYEYSVPICGASPCYQEYGIAGMWEFIVNTSAPIILEGIVSISLVLRVLWQRRRLRQSSQWRKHRRMIIQLFLVSGFNLSLNLPIELIAVAHLCGLPAEYGVEPELYFYFFGYWVSFLFPFASLCQYPELRKNIKKKILCVILKPSSHTAAVGPTTRSVRADVPA